MITFDGNVSWLAVIGSVYDIVGAVVLIRALIWARSPELFRQAVTTWDADPELLRSQCAQKVDAIWGSSILILGFAFQAFASSGIGMISPCLATHSL